MCYLSFESIWRSLAQALAEAIAGASKRIPEASMGARASSLPVFGGWAEKKKAIPGPSKRCL